MNSSPPTPNSCVRPLRSDLSAAVAMAWMKLGEAGTWWTGVERLEVAQQTRAAASCPICAERRQHLPRQSPSQAHCQSIALPDWALVAIHDICNDQTRLSSSWFASLRAMGSSDEHYTELLAIVAIVIAVDTFDFAAGNRKRPLPHAQDGKPSRHRPAMAKPGLAWMPTLHPDDRSATDPDLYQEQPGPRKRGGGHIHHALSLVPVSMMHWWDLFEKMYMSSREMRDFAREYRAISHAQIEFLAARVATLQQCFY